MKILINNYNNNIASSGDSHTFAPAPRRRKKAPTECVYYVCSIIFIFKYFVVVNLN